MLAFADRDLTNRIGCPNLESTCGTSASARLFAGIMALVNQNRPPLRILLHVRGTRTPCSTALAKKSVRAATSSVTEAAAVFSTM